MAKTRRLIAEYLPQVDIVLELLDARIPLSSKNPEIEKLTAGKPVLTLLNKASLASPKITAKWIEQYRANGRYALAIDCITGEGIGKVADAVKSILNEKLKKYEDKGMHGRALKAMIVGIPNVGKSSLINKLGGSKKAKVENRPGVTLDKQWVTTSIGITLLDMPGVLWPKFEDQNIGINLAATGAIKDAITDTETLAVKLAGKLAAVAPEMLASRYKLDEPALVGMADYEILELIGKKRGFLVSGGEIDTERTSMMLLDEFRNGKIGRISLDIPMPTKKASDTSAREDSAANAEARENA